MNEIIIGSVLYNFFFPFTIMEILLLSLPSNLYCIYLVSTLELRKDLNPLS